MKIIIFFLMIIFLNIGVFMYYKSISKIDNISLYYIESEKNFVVYIDSKTNGNLYTFDNFYVVNNINDI